MKIISLVENTTKSELKAKHGLSLYIETKKHKILFDLGPDKTLFENAVKRNIDISKVDTVIISHGHIDHGGALKSFLEVNSSAKIYVQRTAFEPHYSKTLFIKIPVGIDAAIKGNKQIVLLDGDYKIDDELLLFTVDKTNRFYSSVNDTLYDDKGNIMEEAKKYSPDLCVGGYHLFNPLTKKTVSTELLKDIATELQKYKDTEFYTCHCTGKKAFDYLSHQMSNMHYISCGEGVEI